MQQVLLMQVIFEGSWTKITGWLYHLLGLSESLQELLYLAEALLSVVVLVLEEQEEDLEEELE